MKVSIIEQLELPQIPSASGIEVLNDQIFIIGDDAQFLFVLNKDCLLLEKIKLFDAKTKETGRIKKSEKPDLEALTTITHNNETYLLAIASGSVLEIRDMAFLIALKDYQVTKISLLRFYDHLRNIFNDLHAGKLNIEGAIFHQQQLYLFQRGNISGKNLILSLSWNDFMQFEEIGNTESLTIRHFELPILNGLQAGFSGACVLPARETILFTASLENTSNAIDDGPSGGSYIGLLNPIGNSNEIIDISFLQHNNLPYLGKVESITVMQQINENTLHALAVCDEDGNPSRLLQLKISF